MTDDPDALMRKLLDAIERSGGIDIFTKEEVGTLRLVIGWVEFARSFGRLGKVLLWLFSAIGGAYLLWHSIVEKWGGN